MKVYRYKCSVLVFLIFLLFSCKNNKLATPHNGIHVEKYGAKGNDNIDDTDAIQKAILASNGQPIVFDNKKYLVTKTITFKSNTKLIGNGAIIKVPPKSGFHIFRIEGVENIEFSNFQFIGNKDSYSFDDIDRFRAYYAFRINQVKGLRFHKVIFEKQPTSCLQMTDVLDVKIDSCVFKNIGLSTSEWVKKVYSYDAIFIGGNKKSANISIRNSTFSHIGQYEGVDRYSNDGDGIQILDTATGNTENVKIENCVFKECSARGIKIQSGNNFEIKNNTFEYCGSGVGMPTVKPIKDISIHHNQFLNSRFALASNSGAPVGVNQLEVYENKVENAREFLRTSGNSFVENSHFYNNSVNGLDLYFISGKFKNTTFEKNIIKEFGRVEDPSFYMAFLIWDGSENVKILKNEIATSAKTHCAIYLQKGVSQCTIEDNELDIPNKTGQEKHLFHYKESLDTKSNVIRNNYDAKKKLKDQSQN